MAIYGWLPSAIMALGIPLMWNFPIDRRRHGDLRTQIAARRTT
jgi:Na+/melibiose symporter-like transporter